MKIRMLSDTLVAPDGYSVVTWAQDEVRDTFDQLANDLIGAKKAERAKASEPAIVDKAPADQ